jgi:hypothetical protein
MPLVILKRATAGDSRREPEIEPGFGKNHSAYGIGTGQNDGCNASVPRSWIGNPTGPRNAPLPELLL